MSQLKTQTSFPLSTISSFGTGGFAETLIELDHFEDLQQILSHTKNNVWILGYGFNSLISDHGLPGLTVLIRNRGITSNNELLVAEAGEPWDNLVQFAIRHSLWGVELMSGIPGSVGAAVVGNISAYGQAVSDTLAWIDTVDKSTGEILRIAPEKLGFKYHNSKLYTVFKSKIVMRAAFKLHSTQKSKLGYQSAVKLAKEKGLSLTDLGQLRQVIILTRTKAGSMYDISSKIRSRNAGSFFKNPVVDKKTAEKIIEFEEFGRTKHHISRQNKLHGGQSERISAAHVLLAAGFKRGQTWGSVRLHPDHVLKIENTGGATSQQIYNVAKHIQQTVKQKLSVDLEPEVRILGQFDEI